MDVFNDEFRARLNLIMSPSLSFICFSRARIEQMLVSRPILVSTLCQCRETLQNMSTHIDADDRLRFWGTGGSCLWAFEGRFIVS